MNNNIILGIETSCDETAAAVVRNGREILSNEIYSQIDIHAKYGGVVPEIASRNHLDKLDETVCSALESAGCKLSDLSAIAVTCGPGLVGALLVGVSYAKALCFAAEKPLIGLHHIEAHICSNYLNTHLEPPFLSLVVSGGHTHLIYVSSYRDYEILGKTRDDAAGEAFDKAARALGLPYPGGVQIDRLAQTGDEKAVAFPRGMLSDGSLDFSFSGIKSSVLNYLNKLNMSSKSYNINDVAASFQAAVVEVLITKTMEAAEQRSCKTVVLAGGVACNSGLRRQMKAACELRGTELFVPTPLLCTDNAAMIAACGYTYYLANEFHGYNLNAYPSLVIGDRKR